MNIDIIKCTQIRDALRNKREEIIWEIYPAWAKTLVPFWIRAIERIAELIDFAPEKAAKHIAVAKNAFERMDDWHYKRIKYVKARRSEIDSAISFIRNHALDTAVAPYLFAPISRNAAGVLRGYLWLSTYDTPSAWAIPESIWTQKTGADSRNMHYANMQAFHNQ